MASFVYRRELEPAVPIYCFTDGAALKKISATSKGHTYLKYRCPECRKVVSEQRLIKMTKSPHWKPEAKIDCLMFRFGKHYIDCMTEGEQLIFLTAHLLPDRQLVDCGVLEGHHIDRTTEKMEKVAFGLDPILPRHMALVIGGVSRSTMYRTVAASKAENR